MAKARKTQPMLIKGQERSTVAPSATRPCSLTTGSCSLSVLNSPTTVISVIVSALPQDFIAQLPLRMKPFPIHECLRIQLKTSRPVSVQTIASKEITVDLPQATRTSLIRLILTKERVNIKPQTRMLSTPNALSLLLTLQLPHLAYQIL